MECSLRIFEIHKPSEYLILNALEDRLESHFEFAANNIDERFLHRIIDNLHDSVCSHIDHLCLIEPRFCTSTELTYFVDLEDIFNYCSNRQVRRSMLAKCENEEVIIIVKPSI